MCHVDKSPGKVPSFPSLDLLNYLLQTHFVHDEYETDNWIHSASLDPSTAMPELLAILVASGAGFIAEPSIWQFGLALQEVVRSSLSVLVCFDSNSSSGHNLTLFTSSNRETQTLGTCNAYRHSCKYWILVYGVASNARWKLLRALSSLS